jgi:hypothetical protein
VKSSLPSERQPARAALDHWDRWAAETRWDALVVQVWSAVLVVVGALILALELKPRRVTRLPLRSAHDATDAAVTRGGLAGTLRAAATGVDGISSAAVTVRRRRARVTATSAARSRPAEVLGVRQAFLRSLDSVLANRGPRRRRDRGTNRVGPGASVAAAARGWSGLSTGPPPRARRRSPCGCPRRRHGRPPP